MTSETTANGLNGDHWKGAGGQAWVEQQALMDRLNAPIGDRVAQGVSPRTGMQVLDVGCGGGASTLDMGRRVGPTGVCVGVDVSPALLQLARRRAHDAAASEVAFIQADAQVHGFDEKAFDAVISRFGVMFFEDPDAAFANLRRATRPGGELSFACWRSPEENPLSLLPLNAAAPFLSAPPQAPGDEPGRFAFADRDRVLGILRRSGWREIEIVPLDAPTPLSLDELLTLSLRMGLLGAILPSQDAATQSRIREAVTARLADLVVDGQIAMTAACWLVTARR